MKLNSGWIRLRLFLVGGLALRYALAWGVARHWQIPLQDALLAVLLYTSTWSDTQVYFALKNPKETTHARSTDLPSLPAPTFVPRASHR